MPAPSAQVAVVMLTPACDMACAYCGSDASFRPLKEDEAAELMRALAASGFRSVVLGGGEPFCWGGDLRRLAGRAKAEGLEVQVGSNLRRLPAEAPAWDEVDRWVLPLESDDAFAHDALRPGLPSHHGVVLAALEAFRRAGREVTVSSVARPDAGADLIGVGRLLRRLRSEGLRLHAWHLYRFQAMGRAGARNAARFAQDDAHWRGLSGGLRDAFRDLPLLLRPDLLHSKQVAFFWGVAGGVQRQGPGFWSGLQPLPLSLAA